MLLASKRLLYGKVVNTTVAVIDWQKWMASLNYSFTDIEPHRESRRLELANIKLYGAWIMTLLDSDVNPEVVFVVITARSHTRLAWVQVLNHYGRKWKALVLGEVGQVYVTVGLVPTELLFLVVHTKPYSLMVDHPCMKKMRAFQYFEHDIATIPHNKVVLCAVDWRHTQMGGSDWKTFNWRLL